MYYPMQRGLWQPGFVFYGQRALNPWQQFQQPNYAGFWNQIAPSQSSKKSAVQKKQSPVKEPTKINRNELTPEQFTKNAL